MTDVTCTISTKNRTNTTLLLTIESIMLQHVKPDKLIIYDDNDNPDDLRKKPEFLAMFHLLNKAGIDWVVLFGDKKGQVANHHRALTHDVKTKYIWRVDDDQIAEPNVLEELLKEMNEITGAVGCQVWFANYPAMPAPKYAKNSFKSKLTFQPQEWYKIPGVKPVEAEHLYSTFLFNRRYAVNSGGYNIDTTVVGHREETILTHRMYRAGFKLKITPKAVVHHLHQPNGGIRSYTDGALWAQDDAVFQRIMSKEWGYGPELPEDNIIILNNGLGDHYSFRKVMPKILEKNPGVIIAACYPEAFDGLTENIIGLHETSGVYNDHSKWDIYKWCVDNKWKGTFTGAIERMYT